MKVYSLPFNWLISMLAAMLLSISISNPLNAGVICVSNSGNDENSGVPELPFLTIQNALDSASVGDTIKVAVGTYSEYLNTKCSIVLLGGYTELFSDSDRDIFLNKTIVSGISTMMYNDMHGCTIDGFIFNCNSCVTSDALHVSNNSYVSHNIVHGLLSSSENSAIDITGGATVVNNIFDGGWFAMSINSGTGMPIIKNNIITGSSFGINTIGYDASVRTYNNVFGNSFNYTGFETSHGTGDISKDPMFKDVTNNDFRILESSACVDAGDPADLSGYELFPYDTRIDIGAYGGTIYSPYLPPIPDAPVLNSPSNNATQVLRNIGIQWNEVDEAIYYHLQVSTDLAFSSEIIYEIDSLNDTSTQLTNLLYNTTYYWRVSAAVTLGTSQWSEVWNFTTIAMPVTPTEQTSNIIFSDITKNSVKINWEKGNGLSSIIFIKQDYTGTPEPFDNSSYDAESSFGSGSQIGTSGWFCVYNGGASTITVNNLESSTSYRAMALTYNGSNGDEKYLLDANTSNIDNFTTLCDYDFYGSDPQVHLYFRNPTTYDVEISLSHSCGSTKLTFYEIVLTDNSFYISVYAYPNSGYMEGSLSADGSSFNGTYNISFAYLNQFGIPISCGTKSGNWSASAKLCVQTDIENMSEESFTLYPNPADNVLYFQGIKNEIKRVSILTLDGKLIKEINEKGLKQIDISDLPEGIYLIRIENSNCILSKKIIKLNR
ncbi:MAG: T9SS type A sorting domain-containing protein [Bacteroidota bacterium]